jgi:hypothetical protein
VTVGECAEVPVDETSPDFIAFLRGQVGFHMFVLTDLMMDLMDTGLWPEIRARLAEVLTEDDLVYMEEMDTRPEAGLGPRIARKMRAMGFK